MCFADGKLYYARQNPLTLPKPNTDQGRLD